MRPGCGIRLRLYFIHLQASKAVEDLQKNLEEETLIVEEKKQTTLVSASLRGCMSWNYGTSFYYLCRII